MKEPCRYGKNLTKALKKADVIHCQVVDGEIYIGDDSFIVKMNENDYELLVRPITKCEAGNWRYTSYIKEESADLNLKGLFVKAATAEINKVTKPSMTFNAKKDYVGYYNSENNTVIVLNKLYDSIFDFDTNIEVFASNSISPVIFTQTKTYTTRNFDTIKSDPEPIGVVMPIRYKADKGNMYKFTKSVRAWYKN